jgi:hypothetical protein
MSNAAERLLSEVLDYLVEGGMESSPPAQWIRGYFGETSREDRLQAAADEALASIRERT